MNDPGAGPFPYGYGNPAPHGPADQPIDLMPTVQDWHEAGQEAGRIIAAFQQIPSFGQPGMEDLFCRGMRRILTYYLVTGELPQRDAIATAGDVLAGATQQEVDSFLAAIREDHPAQVLGSRYGDIRDSVMFQAGHRYRIFTRRPGQKANREWVMTYLGPVSISEQDGSWDARPSAGTQRIPWSWVNYAAEVLDSEPAIVDHPLKPNMERR